MARWAAYLLGETRLVAPDGKAHLPSAPVAALLALLTTRKTRRISRGMAARTLWPDHDEDNGRHSLASCLWRFKKEADGAQLPLVADGDTIALDRRCWVDALAFEARLDEPAGSTAERQRLWRAIALYRGSFLEACDETWAIIERERIECRFVDSLVRLATIELERGGVCEAGRMARQAAAMEPLREDAHRLVMRSHAAAGNRALGIRQYRICREILRAELDVEPMPETIDLAHELFGAALDHVPHTPVGPVPSASRPGLPTRPAAELRAAVIEGRQAIASALAAIDRSLTLI